MVLPLFIYPHKNTPNPFPRAPSMCDIQSDNSASSCESFHHTLLLQLLKDAPRKRWVLFSFMGGEKPKSSEVRKVSDRTTRSRHSCVKFQTFYFSHKMQSWEVDSSSPVATLLRLKSVFILCNSVYVILVIFVSFSSILFKIFLSSFVFIFALPQKLIDKEKVSDEVTVSGIP